MLKNQHIIHWIDVDDRYLCNKAVTRTISKSTGDWSLVTCKNCLKRKETEE